MGVQPLLPEGETAAATQNQKSTDTQAMDVDDDVQELSLSLNASKSPGKIEDASIPTTSTTALPNGDDISKRPRNRSSSSDTHPSQYTYDSYTHSSQSYSDSSSDDRR